MHSRTDRPRVKVFALGGTIASTAGPDPVAGVTPTLSAEDLVATPAASTEDITLETTTFRQSASSDLTMADVVSLATEITACLRAGIDGVVITQGTSTIEETAFALDLLVDSAKPLVVTGAMRNPTLAGADGPANLLAAIRVAASPSARGLGTVVVFNDEIHAARFVRKSHTANPAAFISSSLGPIGWIVEGRTRIATRPSALPAIEWKPNRHVPAVALVKMSLGDDGGLIDAISSIGYAGAVIEGFGGGHIPAALVPSVQRLAEGIPVVLASRTGAGEVLRNTYGFPGGERDLLSRGLLNAGYLDGPKARILLSLCLGSQVDKDAIRARFKAVAES
jgi:L-asparaginase